jgi:hypothetical protein
MESICFESCANASFLLRRYKRLQVKTEFGRTRRLSLGSRGVLQVPTACFRAISSGSVSRYIASDGRVIDEC